jgi:hypothetical protein
VKALGLGLSYPLDAFCTGPQDAPPRLRPTGGAPYSDWTLTDLAPAEGYKGAVAVRSPMIALRSRQAEWPWLLDGVRKTSVPRDATGGCASL